MLHLESEPRNGLFSQLISLLTNKPINTQLSPNKTTNLFILVHIGAF